MECAPKHLSVSFRHPVYTSHEVGNLISLSRQRLRLRRIIYFPSPSGLTGNPGALLPSDGLVSVLSLVFRQFQDQVHRFVRPDPRHCWHPLCNRHRHRAQICFYWSLTGRFCIGNSRFWTSMALWVKQNKDFCLLFSLPFLPKILFIPPLLFFFFTVGC